MGRSFRSLWRLLLLRQLGLRLSLLFQLLLLLGLPGFLGGQFLLPLLFEASSASFPGLFLLEPTAWRFGLGLLPLGCLALRPGLRLLELPGASPRPAPARSRLCRFRKSKVMLVMAGTLLVAP